MRNFARVFPAKARKIVASTDWNGGSSRVFFEDENKTLYNFCPIGLAMYTCGEHDVRMPSPSGALRLLHETPQNYNEAAIENVTYDALDLFMMAFDKGHLTNEDIADIFGYPELAHS
jgi:hypothetical protein